MKHARLDELVRAERRAPARPSKAEARSVWARIDANLGAGAVPVSFDVPPGSVTPVVESAAPAGLLSSVGAKVTAAAGVAGIAAVAAVAVPSSVPEPDVEEAADVAVVDTPAGPTGEQERAPERDPVPTEVPSQPGLDDGSPADRRATLRQAKRGATHEAGRSRGRGDDTAPAVQEEGIGREVDLIKRAGRALSAGDHGEALQLLDEHARAFPQGTLTEDRSALRALSLCAAGRIVEGQRAKNEFLARWPRSVHAERVEDGCSANP